MVTYGNTTTARLEGYARARGLHLGILIATGNRNGRYFAVNAAGKLLSHWGELGWTVAEARERIDEWSAPPTAEEREEREAVKRSYDAADGERIR